VALETSTTYVYYRTNHRDHIYQVDEEGNGDTACRYHVAPPHPNELVKTSDLTDRARDLIANDTSDFCSHCIEALDGIPFAEEASDELPEFSCPKCGKPARSVVHWNYGSIVTHFDADQCAIERQIYEEWRRGGNHSEIPTRA
jgi:hypothetical protein